MKIIDISIKRLMITNWSSRLNLTVAATVKGRTVRPVMSYLRWVNYGVSQ